MKILVTGATGQLGSKVMAHLLEHGSPRHLIASVSNTKKAEYLKKKGVDVRHGDFDFSHTLDHAFKGAERMLLISTTGDNEARIRQHLAAVEAAKLAKIKFIVYTSVAKADTTTLWLGEVHRATEAAIRASGIPYCFLRNNWYLENETAGIKAALEGAPVTTCAGEGRVGWAPREDYALAAANVLTGNGHSHKIYELSGTPTTYTAYASALSIALGKEVPLQELDENDYASLLPKSGMPAPMVRWMLNIQRAIRKGELDGNSGDLEKLLGRPVTPLLVGLEEIIKDMAVPA